MSSDSLGEKMTPLSGARNLKAKCTPKSCEDNCSKLISNDDEKYNNWAELVQCLDKRSIMMLKSEYKGNGLPDNDEYFTTVHEFSKTPTSFSDLKKPSKIQKTGKNWKNAVTRVTPVLMQRCLFREKMLWKFREKVSAATKTGIWRSFAQKNSALFARNLDTVSVFRRENWEKSLENSTIFIADFWVPFLSCFWLFEKSRIDFGFGLYVTYVLLKRFFC